MERSGHWGNPGRRRDGRRAAFYPAPNAQASIPTALEPKVRPGPAGAADRFLETKKTVVLRPFDAMRASFILPIQRR